METKKEMGEVYRVFRILVLTAFGLTFIFWFLFLPVVVMFSENVSLQTTLLLVTFMLYPIWVSYVLKSIWNREKLDKYFWLLSGAFIMGVVLNILINRTLISLIPEVLNMWNRINNNFLYQ